jgi:transposase
MKKFFIGIDISKDSLDVCIFEKDSAKLISEFCVKNSESGIAGMLKKIVRQKIDLKDSWFCFEHTGVYGLLLAYCLDQNDVCYSVVPALEIMKSMGITRGKNDKVDARRIAEYACMRSNKLKPSKFPSETLLRLKQLLTYRNQQVKIGVQLKNSLASHKIVIEPLRNNLIIDDIKAQISTNKKKIKVVEKEILTTIKSDQSVYKNYCLATSIIGIGPIITFYAIAYTSNFTSFDDARKFNCYVGIAPFGKKSGTSIDVKPKVSHLANRKIKALLYNGANSAAQYDIEIRSYYNRKISEGKDHQQIMNAIACKLVARLFAVIKRQTPYVSLFSHNFSQKNLVMS